MTHRLTQLSAALLAVCIVPSLALAAEPGAAIYIPPVWAGLPFVGMLMSIALLPLFLPKFWEHHFPKVTGAWAVLAIVLMMASVPSGMSIGHAYGERFFSTAEDYVAFIILLGSLYVITGGIHISGHLPGTSLVNTVMLLIGSILASVIGTTGASMLMIRPLVRANQGRRFQVHTVVFFIFLVSNIGGVLTPVGDPPLFLGFLQGVPFDWTLKLFPHWATCVFLLLFLYYFWDSSVARLEKIDLSHDGLHFRVAGKRNIPLLLGAVGVVVVTGVVHFETTVSFFGLGQLHLESVLRDLVQIGLALLSIWITAPHVRKGNNFNYGPIREVAILFIGIFATMIPAVMLLQGRGAELGLDSPAKFFWFSGALSSFLDNAPTYVTFLAAGMGYTGAHDIAHLIAHPQGVRLLEAISAGSVFMGANSYIGNGPNFMVKAIAEQGGVKMPSFFGYMGYSVALLLPLFGLITFIFFR